VLVQLSTGSPQEARENVALARIHVVDFLDGAILTYPDQIGTPDASIVVSGAESAFRRSEPLLKIFAENLSFLGEKVGAASALDYAFASFYIAGLLGFVHGARICEVEGVRVDEFGSLLADTVSVLGGEVKRLGETIQAGKYENPQVSLGGWAAVTGRLMDLARDAQINSEFPTFASALFQKGISAGYDMEEVSSLIKVLRAGA
jgi:3-hydroxyisobutyrate dehydrogenase-like beta-hydroxyacid dehydrogenase